MQIVKTSICSCTASGSREYSGLWLTLDRKSTRLNSSHTEIYTLSLHDALPISWAMTDTLPTDADREDLDLLLHGFRISRILRLVADLRSEEHTSELQSHRDLHSFPTRRSSDLVGDDRHTPNRCRS